MRRFALVTALALVFGAVGAIAVAQNGDGGNPPANEDNPAAQCAEENKTTGAFGECVAERASAFGRCVEEAARSGADNPARACAELKPGDGNGQENGNGNGEGDGNGDGDGAGNGNGAGVENNPTAGLTLPPDQDGREFGQQVSENAQQLGNGNGTSGQAHNPTAEQTLPPQQGGQEFGQQVSENAAGNAPGGP